MLVTTTNDVPGYRVVKALGVVRGIVVRTPTIGQAFAGGLRSLGGGNIREYVEVCEDARQHAYELLVEHAEEIGANAIIGVRYDATELGENMTKVLAYGTAVLVEPE